MSGKIIFNSGTIKLNSDKILFGIPVIKNWFFVESNSNSTAFSPRVINPIASGIGCATSGDAQSLLDSSFPASDYNVGDYARVTIADEDFNFCINPSFHWFVVGS
jgi:hypothetical protein